MKLWDLVYKIQGELPDGPPPWNSDVQVVVVTDDGRVYEPEQASFDGELMIINARAVGERR